MGNGGFIYPISVLSLVSGVVKDPSPLIGSWVSQDYPPFSLVLGIVFFSVRSLVVNKKLKSLFIGLWDRFSSASDTICTPIRSVLGCFGPGFFYGARFGGLLKNLKSRY